LEATAASLTELHLACPSLKLPTEPLISVLQKLHKLQILSFSGTILADDTLIQVCQSGAWLNVRSIDLSQCIQISLDAVTIVLRMNSLD
jgi:hypothetical protein